MEAVDRRQQAVGRGRGARYRHLYKAAEARRINPGGNHITASVRETYGTAHQVGMNSNLPQFKEKEMLVRWGVEGAGLLQLPPTALIIVDPSRDMKALNNHIKWDHHQKQLLYEEEEVKVVPHAKIAKDSAGNLSCGSSNSGTYFTASEGEDCRERHMQM